MATSKTETAEERRRRGLETVECPRELRGKMPVLDAASLIPPFATRPTRTPRRAPPIGGRALVVA